MTFILDEAPDEVSKGPTSGLTPIDAQELARLRELSKLPGGEELAMWLKAIDQYIAREQLRETCLNVSKP